MANKKKTAKTVDKGYEVDWNSEDAKKSPRERTEALRPSKKEFFDDSDRYTQGAEDIDRELSAALLPVITRYRTMGYSVRDITGMIVRTAIEIEQNINSHWHDSHGGE